MIYLNFINEFEIEFYFSTCKHRLKLKEKKQISFTFDNNLSAKDLFMDLIFHTIIFHGAKTSGYKEFIECTGNILYKCLGMKIPKENACKA